jgi:hypothetical protein
MMGYKVENGDPPMNERKAAGIANKVYMLVYAKKITVDQAYEFLVKLLPYLKSELQDRKYSDFIYDTKNRPGVFRYE